MTLVKDQCILYIRKYTFSQSEWNKLSTDCVNASSLNMFKTKLTNILEGRVTHQ